MTDEERACWNIQIAELREYTSRTHNSEPARLSIEGQTILAINERLSTLERVATVARRWLTLEAAYQARDWQTVEGFGQVSSETLMAELAEALAALDKEDTGAS